MKKILTFIVLLTASVFAMTCNAEVKYKGYLNVGGSVTSGDTYQYVKSNSPQMDRFPV